MPSVIPNARVRAKTTEIKTEGKEPNRCMHALKKCQVNYGSIETPSFASSTVFAHSDVVIGCKHDQPLLGPQLLAA